ncbi:hypothetical protein FOL47_008556 [Perkinsus chesapeaki]|uniref:C3H1-type domain-containing protein n=1 Tax=Perkinsus chesapeaki TaxID=330153 RepID=A0A7J6LD66_PERCH|nr:hypothetical protein FOL47_008556 [Perkinsus chesapeaki]
MSQPRRANGNKRSNKRASTLLAASPPQLLISPSEYTPLKPGLLDNPDYLPEALLSPINSSSDAATCLYNGKRSSWAKGRLHKTKVCRYFVKGRCKFGESCTYAHWSGELQARPDFYKTRICNKTNCSDEACPYAHSIFELRDPPTTHETICQAYLEGQCYDVRCPMAHNQVMAKELSIAARFEHKLLLKALRGMSLS